MGAPLWVRGPPPRPELEGERLFCPLLAINFCKRCARHLTDQNLLIYKGFRFDRSNHLASISRHPSP
jgi:hypothetical protein